MRKSWILVILLFSSIFLNLFFWQTIREGNRVMEVVDGDTFQLKSGKRVRLMGVDAPEFDRCGGKEAKEKLASLILGKIVSLKEETPEAFGRTLALVFTDKNFVNKIIMGEGWGRPDYRKNSKREELTAAFKLAKEKKLGIFKLCREEGITTGCLIKGNIDPATSEKFYHLPNCRYYEDIVIEKDRGEGYFCSEEEAISAGFKKASGCP